MSSVLPCIIRGGVDDVRRRGTRLLIALIAFSALAGCQMRHASVPVATNSVSVPAAGGATVISLTFDDAYKNQWLYAAPLLRAHHMTATFYVITADSDGPQRCCMSWTQLRTLQDEGNDIGSHPIDHPYLTHLGKSQITAEVCGSRQDMLINGIHNPVSFAYPFGAVDSTAEQVVEQCGFSNARQGGGVSASNSAPSPPYAETLPPKDPYDVRTIAVDGASPIQLADLPTFVSAVAAHGGGWLPITFHQVCDTHAADYTHCMSTYGPIQDTVLAQFLAWLQAAGQPSGAPAGVVVHTMQQAITANP